MPPKKPGGTDTPAQLKLKDAVRATCAGSGDLEKLDAVHIMHYFKAKYPDNSGLKALFQQQAAFANDMDPSYMPPCMLGDCAPAPSHKRTCAGGVVANLEVWLW